MELGKVEGLWALSLRLTYVVKSLWIIGFFSGKGKLLNFKQQM